MWLFICAGLTTSRPLGCMERLLNARRSWSGELTTPHLSASTLAGPPITRSELSAALEHVVEIHPLLRATIHGKSKCDVAHAEPYPLHSDYLGNAFKYGDELLRTGPEADPLRFEPSTLSAREIAQRGLSVEEIDASVELGLHRALATAMDHTSIGDDAPQWRLTLVRSTLNGDGCGLLWAANHAISDQLSHQRVLSQLLEAVATLRRGDPLVAPASLALPPSVEEAVIGWRSGWCGWAQPPGLDDATHMASDIQARLRQLLRVVTLATIGYSIFQIGAGGVPLLPQSAPEPTRVGDELSVTQRDTGVVFFKLGRQVGAQLRSACRERGLTVPTAINAALLLVAADALKANAADGEEPTSSPPASGQGSQWDEVSGERAPRKLKLLQAIDLRRFGAQSGMRSAGGTAASDWSGGSVVAGTGSLDLLVEVLPGTVAVVRSTRPLPRAWGEYFWRVAAECGRQTRGWVGAGWAREALLLFAAGWEFMNMNRVVELGAQDRSTLGRAYSCATSNAGVFAHPTRYGDITLDKINFGISQSVSAPAISMSSVTVDGVLCLTLTYCRPIWSDEAAREYGEAVCSALERIAASDD